jgi:hypothetical protein
MTMQQEEAVLSGLDPFAEPRDRDAEEAWFHEPGSSRVRPLVAPSAPPPPIGDREADRWFR